MDDSEFKERFKKAQATVSRLDNLDGFKDRYIGTIMAALEAGIRNPDSNSHFDALVMLHDLRQEEVARLKRKL